MLVDLHDSRLVPAPVAVVGCGEDGHNLRLVGPVVPVHDELVCAGDESEAVLVVVLLADVGAEREAGASGRDSPAAPVVGVGPEEVAHGSLVGNLLDAVELANVVQSVDGRREATVQAEDGVANESGERKEVEEVREVLPDVGVAVLAKALVVEAVNLGDLTRLVVAAENGEAVGVADLFKRYNTQ